MKKVLFNCILLLVLSITIGGLWLTVFATENEEIVVEDGIVVSYAGSKSTVVIPEQIDGVKIIGIGESAFRDNLSIQHVVISDSVTYIGQNAFRGCSNLVDIELPDGLKRIDDYTFYECFSLQNVTLPTALEEISTWAFGYCKKLDNIVLPDGLKSIGAAAFYGCESIKEVVIPDTVTAVNTHCFRGCSSLSQITLSEQMTSIPFRFFSGCTALMQVDIPKSITEIGKEAFYQSGIVEIIGGEGLIAIGEGAFFECYSLKSINKLNSVRSIGDQAFYGCGSLCDFEMPESLISVGVESFYNCGLLRQIIFPEGFASIGDKAFYGCDMLSMVVLPSTVETIGELAFKECVHLWEIYNLSEIDIVLGSDTNGRIASNALCVHHSINDSSCLYSEGDFVFWKDEEKCLLVLYSGDELFLSLPSTYGEEKYDIYSYSFYNNNKLTSLNIPEGIERIYSNAFTGVDKLKTLHLPHSITNIDDGALQGLRLDYSIIYNGDKDDWGQIKNGDVNDIPPYRITYLTQKYDDSNETIGFWQTVKNDFSSIFADLERNIFFLNFLLTLFWGLIFLYSSRRNDSEHRKRNRKLIFVLIVCAQWILISGLRADSVGADTSNYMSLFDQHIRMDLGTILRNIKEYYLSGTFSIADEYEPGYILLERLIGVFTTSHTTYKFIIAIIFTSALGYYTYKNSDDPCLSFILYDALFYNMFSLTGYRQVVACAIVGLYGYELIKKRKTIPFIILLLIGSMFQRSTLVFILFYVLADKKITRGYVASVIGITGVMIVFRNQLFNYFKVVFGYEQYAGTYGFAQQTFMLLLIAFTLVAIYRYSVIISTHSDSKQYYNGLILMWLFFPFAMVSPSAMRLVYDFGFVLMLLLPQIIMSFKRPNDRALVYFSAVAILGFFIFTRSPIYQFA